MKHEPRTTLVVTAGELRDLIEAVQLADWANNKAISADPGETPLLQAFAGRIRTLLRRLQETEAILAARKSKYPEAFYTWLASKYQLTRYQLAVLDDDMQAALLKEWETDYGGEK